MTEDLVIRPEERGAKCIGLYLSRTPETPEDEAKREWKQAILESVKKRGEEMVPGAPFMTITMPCGNMIQYQNFEDIPDEDVPCSCGDENHWFVVHAIVVKIGKN